MLHILLLALLPLALSQNFGRDPLEWKCPKHWEQFQSSCYKFVKSPLRSRNEARRNCQVYEADLVSISSLEEHGFLVFHLLWQDPQHRRWYVGSTQQSPGLWVNDGDGSSMSDLNPAFLHDSQDSTKQYLTYRFSEEKKRWGFEAVSGEEPLLYICEVPVSKLHYLVVDDRNYKYGFEETNPDLIPQGPYFVKQPETVVFDMTQKGTNDVTLSCMAGGYPTPTYEWFKEEYALNLTISRPIDPLRDSRYTISGGSLIIHNPTQHQDRGSYHCKASNDFGAIISETIQLVFGSIGEFNLKRPKEEGSQNWGKAIFCDPPQFYSSVKYYWAREYFPNFVEEDRRVFVSNDGALYFSALEKIDEGNYSCNVQSKVSDTGRNGPFFPLHVIPLTSFQQLRFTNSFPKTFPEAPVVGREVRLECIAFGYPVPHYNWTRSGSNLPRTAKLESFNRVLIIPKVQVEDQGTYICTADNGKASITKNLLLTVQAEPNFTIPITDKHMDKQSDLTWTCEAFGIPDVTYSWYKNGELIELDKLPAVDKDRFQIQDNVLNIRYLDPDRDPGMFQCQARNTLKTAYSSAQLRVLSIPPSFKKKPLELETYAAEQGNVTIICNPEAAPKPQFTWRKDNTVIGSGGRRRILENGNLLISPVSRDDEGIYICTAENIYGKDESRGRLVVLRGPAINERLPPKILTSVGKDLSIYCSATSEDILDIAYIWNHNGISLANSYDRNHKVKLDGGHLYIRNITFSDTGTYDCVVKSAVGTVSTRTNLIVEGPPGPPGGVQVISIDKKSAVLQWTDGAAHGKEITYYVISGKTRWNNTWVVLANNILAREIDRYNGRKEAGVEGLTPYSRYTFQVQAANEFGPGIPSLPSPQYNTLSDKPYKAPERIGGGGGKIGDLVIMWEPLKPEHQNGPGIYYKIFWRRHKGETEFQTQILKEEGNIGVAVVKVPFDHYYTLYDIKVQAANDQGFGPESEIKTIYSAEDMPQAAPQQVHAFSYNSTAINITWTPISQTRQNVRGKLIGHRLKYWKKDNKEDDAVYYLSRSTRPWALVVGLQPDTYYYVKVMAYNSAGEGPESERDLQRTYRKAPQKPPSSVNVLGINPSTISVEWRYVQPTLEEEPVTGFKVRIWEIDQDMSTANDTIIPLGSELKATISDLSPGKVYHLRVLAFSNGGDGRMSSPAFTFQLGDSEILRGTASVAYYRSFYLSLIITFFILYA